MKDSKNEAVKHGLQIPVVTIKRSAGNTLLTKVRASTSTVTSTLVASKVKDTEGCIICRDSFNPGDTVIRLPHCSHTFHEDCGMQWLTTHNTCPTCRRELPTDDEDYENERRREGRSHRGHDGEVVTGREWETLLFG